MEVERNSGDDGRLRSGDGALFVDSTSAAVTSDAVCMEVGEEGLVISHAGPSVGEMVAGASCMLGSDLSHGAAGLPGADCLDSGEDVHGRLHGWTKSKAEEGAMGAVEAGMPSINICTQGVCSFAAAKCSASGGLENGPVSPVSSVWTQRKAWCRPPVIPLLPVEQLIEVRDGVDWVRLDSVEVCDTVKRFEHALVGRLFGKRIPFSFLNAELHRRWQRFGSFRLITVSADCFICFFNSAESREAVLIGGPWFVADQVLGVDVWTPGFSPSSNAGVITPIWVRLPGLPLYCWGSKSIARIAGSLGVPLWIDDATESIKKGVFARVCIRIDLSKALKPGLWVDGPYGSFFQKVEYEGLGTFCYLCGHVGHKAINCQLHLSQMAARPSKPGTGDQVVNEVPNGCSESVPSWKEQIAHVDEGAVPQPALENKSVDSLPNESTSFGPWMLVQRRKKQIKNVRRGATIGQSSFPNIKAHLDDGFPASVQQSKGVAQGAMMEDHSRDSSSSAGRSMGWRARSEKDLRQNGEAREGKVQHSVFSPLMHVQEDLPLASTGFMAQPMAVPNDALAIGSKVVATDTLPPVVVDQPIFDGFKAAAGCSSGRAARLGAVRRSALHRKDRQSSPLHSSCSPDLVVGPCELPVPPLSLVVHSAHLGAIVPYCQRLYEDVLPPHDDEEAELLLLEGSPVPVEGSLVEGHRSLKVERMLKDLGPISSLPRKRRLIAVDPDGGDASPSLPP